MPRPKHKDWERVTITISSEVAQQLRLLAAMQNSEMGRVADTFLKESTIKAHLEYAMGKGPKP